MKWHIFQTSVGTRLEYSQLDYYEKNEKKDGQSKKYLSFLPAFSIGCEIKEWNIELIAKEYIERPSYRSLSNTTEYTSAVTRWQGNPFLQDTKIIETNLESIYKNLYLSLGYQRIVNQIFEVNLPSETSDKILIVKPMNLPTYNSFSLETSYSLDWGFWHPSFNFIIQYQDLKYGNPIQKYNKPIAEFIMDNRFSIKNDWNFWLSLDLRSKGNYATGYTYGYENIGFIVTKSFFDKTFMIKFQCRDIFNKGRERIEVKTNNLCFIDKSNGNTRCIKLTLTYNFNKSPKKYKGEKISSSEINRIKRINKN